MEFTCSDQKNSNINNKEIQQIKRWSGQFWTRVNLGKNCEFIKTMVEHNNNNNKINMKMNYFNNNNINDDR